MNSVLQCLSNTKPLLLYVLKNDLENELNKSSTSVMKGVLMRGENRFDYFEENSFYFDHFFLKNMRI